MTAVLARMVLDTQPAGMRTRWRFALLDLGEAGIDVWYFSHKTGRWRYDGPFSDVGQWFHEESLVWLAENPEPVYVDIASDSTSPPGGAPEM